ncbi:MAG: radical SAM protein [Bacteroidales bacterium]
MYNYLFGPVPSRRLGMSLGVDLVPHKVCSLNCVYCEVGETTNRTVVRDEYIPYEKVTDELNNYFENNPDPDYITFSGYGEPTLNSRVGDVLKFIKTHKPGVPVAVLTNGTLFYQQEVRQVLQEADLVLPSLDAATEEGFRRINRPDPSLKIDTYIRGLVEFRKIYTGKIWLEVLILPGYNDDEAELKALKEAILKIQPDRVQVNTLDRPGTVKDLRGATRTELQHVLDVWQLENAEIIAPAAKRKNIKTYRSDKETAILETIARRPCTVDDLISLLGLHVNEINKYLDVLEAEKRIRSVKQERGIFYQLRHS